MEIKISQIENNTGQIPGVPKNPRTITEKEYEAIVAKLESDPASIEEEPLLLYDNDGTYVAVGGNQRLRAIKQLGWTSINHVSRIIPYGTDPEIIQQKAIQHNLHAGEWDWDMLANEWDETDLEEWGLDTVADWANGTELPKDIDDVPEPPKTPISKLGDLWLLGNHRVLCGDSTDRETVERLMDGKKADMVFTDPPYGMDLDTDYTKMGDGGRKYDAVIADNVQFNAAPLLSMFSYCNEMFLWGADYYVETLGRQYPNLGSWVIWDKYSDSDRIGLLDGRFGSTFETCWSKTPHKREIARVLVTTNYTARGDETRVHPTQKPVQLAQWFFKRWGRADDIVVDLFLGSGSTLIACEQTKRKCYGLELDPKYVDVICKRYQQHTGEMPILERTGEPHDFQ